MSVYDNYQCEGQLSLFDIGKMPYDIKKPIRLIEAFGGIGSQIQALKNIGANIDKGRAYKLIEIDQYAVKSYNAMHGTEFIPVDITKVKSEDLEIVDKDKYTYVFFYSFPCTDISLAGKMLGYDENSGTRSSLLWEVRRILKECKDKPQVLICENVPQIHSKANADNFQKFIEFLDSIGYSTTYTDMNAKDYGIPQSRNRTFIVSILGNYEYHFPNPVPLKHNLNDYLEPTVDEKYYLKNDKAKELIDKLILDGKILRGGVQHGCDLSYSRGQTREYASAILRRYDGGINPHTNERTGVCEVISLRDESQGSQNSREADSTYINKPRSERL